MNVQEKLQAIEALWSSLLKTQESIESPNWHADILAERKAKIDNGKAQFTSLNELRKTQL